MTLNREQALTVEEAEAILAYWRKSNMAQPEGIGIQAQHPYAGALSALDGFDAFQPPTAGPSRSESESLDEARAFASNKFAGRSREPQAMKEFEQQTWDLYGMQGTLDHTKLRFECQVRAQSGDDEAKRRLAVLHSFHDERQKNRDRRWDLPPDRPDPIEALPDPQVVKGCRRWALLIGNDSYPQSPLQGSVNDSKAWESYLTEFLGVPSTQITIIEDADRKTMVTALYDLRDNPNIKEGDHILFAFSGHGSSFNAKRYSFEDDVSLRAGSIEAICPVDRGLPPERGTPDISDRELLLILSDVHDQTKASITVVLDCCHSGGGTRELDDDDSVSGKGDPSRRSRSIAPLVDQKVIERMFAEADDHPRRRPSNLSVRSPAWATDTIDIYRPALLAACQDTELAWEENMQGAFTSAMLKVLRSEQGRVLTCSGLIEAISPISRSQKPMFDGEETQLFLR